MGIKRDFDEDDVNYKIPDEGVLEFDFYEVKRLPNETNVVTNDTIPHLAKALLGQPEGMQRMKVLKLIAAEKTSSALVTSQRLF